MKSDIAETGIFIISYSMYLYHAFQLSISQKEPLWQYFHFVVDPCSHCYMLPGETDGPCKDNSDGLCVNQGLNVACSTTKGSFGDYCYPQYKGKRINYN